MISRYWNKKWLINGFRLVIKIHKDIYIYNKYYQVSLN